MSDGNSNKSRTLMFILVYILRLSFASVDEILPCWSVRMKATGQYFLVVLFTMFHKLVLAFEFVDEILKCHHSNESY